MKGSWISMISSKDRRFGTGTSDFNTFLEIMSGAMPFSVRKKRGKRPRGVDGASGVNGRREKKEGALLSQRERVKLLHPTTQLVFMFAAHDVVCVQLSSKERHISRIELNYFHMIYHTYLC